jgi:glycosyltransferase involved in cell wall biosynthesis
MTYNYSVIVPAYNEEGGIGSVLQELLATLPRERFELIVVDDCSKDKTLERARAFEKSGVRVFHNIENFGYGYSLKRGIKEARHDHVVILDADGSYPVASIPELVAEYEKGYDMVVGIRQGELYHGGVVKRVARVFFRALSEFTTGRRIPDINSGLRVFRKDLARSFFHTLSSGFSFTTTITLAFMLNSYSVRYLPVPYHKRKGASKVRYFRDTLRASQIIVESIAYYNPLKLFFLGATIVFLTGCVSFGLSFFSFKLALFLFLAIFGATLVFSIGFIAIFLKFAHNDPRSRGGEPR